MPQEIVPEARALRRALDDAGDVRHDEGHALIHVHDAEVREERGEVVVCDLGMGLAHHGQEGGLAHVRKAHKAHVGQELELERNVMALAGKARLCKARHLACGGGKVHVAPAAAPAAGCDPVLAVGHVVHDGAALRIADDGAARDLDIQGLPVLAVAALARAVGAVAGDVLALVAEVHQGRHVLVHAEDHIAAAAAVAPVRAARCHVFFTVKGHRPVAALAGVNRDAGLVNKS